MTPPHLRGAASVRWRPGPDSRRGRCHCRVHPPFETRDLSSALAIVAVVLTATGSARDIAAGIQRFRERFGSRAQVRGLPEQRQTPGERLAEVDRLHKEGSITDEERAEQRSRILGEL
jgi:hypothetical protein